MAQGHVMLKRLAALASVVLFAAALMVLRHVLRQYHYHDIVRELRAIPASKLVLGLVLTIASYAILTVYDALALVTIRHPISYARTAFASFVSYSFSHNLGTALLTGGSVRLRLYGAWGLSAVEVGSVLIFGALTFWAGFVGLGSAIFLVVPVPVPPDWRLPLQSLQPVGWICLVLSAGYLALSLRRNRTLALWRWSFTIPPFTVALEQFVLGAVDWIIAGAVAYVLMPMHSALTLPVFLGAFLMAQFVGVVSHVPGGVGVFETTVLYLLTPSAPAASIASALIAYRIIYYVVPLGLAALMLAASELRARHEDVKRVARAVSRIAPAVVPQLLAVTTFASGAILLFSGATPPVGTRLHWLAKVLPLEVIEVSHLLGSVVGMALLLLSWGLQRRLDAAYVLSAVLLGAGALLSLLKGVDYEEAAVLAVMLAALLPCHRHFYRKTSFWSERFTPGWIIAIALVVVTSVWLGLFSFKHVEFAADLWWRFSLRGAAPRFLRASVGVAALLLGVALVRLLRPTPPEPSLPEAADLARARAIIDTAPFTLANLALLGDKSLLFSDNGLAFLMYAIEKRAWVAMGDPVGPKADRIELAWRFHEMSDRHDGWTVFYQVHPDNLSLYLDLGLTLLKLGEEARVPLEQFTLEGGGHKDLRRTVRKHQELGCEFAVVPASETRPLMPELRRISDAWLNEKNTREKRFSLGCFDERYLAHHPIAVIRAQGQVVAFANVWCGAEHEELSVDLMRHDPAMSTGLMEYLFVELMLWGKERSYRWFNLGMAPLSGMEDRSLAPLWSKLGAFVFRQGEHFYNFQGLRQYKQKFDPQWEPRYLASPGGLRLPAIVSSLAALISGGWKGIVGK